MPQLDSYLFFNGNCADAMRFYERTLGGTLERVMRFADAPAGQQCGAPGSGDLVMHACLRLDGRLLMASDCPPAHQQKMGGFALALNYGQPQEARRVFDALSPGGTVTMAMQKTFWAETFGMLTDRFGTAWMVSGGAQAA